MSKEFVILYATFLCTDWHEYEAALYGIDYVMKEFYALWDQKITQYRIGNDSDES